MYLVDETGWGVQSKGRRVVFVKETKHPPAHLSISLSVHHSVHPSVSLLILFLGNTDLLWNTKVPFHIDISTFISTFNGHTFEQKIKLTQIRTSELGSVYAPTKKMGNFKGISAKKLILSVPSLLFCLKFDIESEF